MAREVCSSTTSPTRAIRKLAKRLYEPRGRTGELREAHSIGLGVVGDRILAAIQSRLGVQFWDLTDVRNPELVSFLRLPAVNGGDYTFVAWQLSWQGRYVYVAGSNLGVFIVDASDPARPVLADRGAGRPNPVPVGELGGFRVGPIFAVGNLLVLSSMDVAFGYATLDISDPLNPELLDYVNRGLTHYYATSFNGNRIIASVRGAGARMAIHSTGDPTSITLVNDALVVDEQLYNATQDQFVIQGCQDEIVKVDVSNPSQYRVVGRGSLGVDHADHGQVTPMGNLVYVGNDHGTGSGWIVHDVAPDTRAPAVTMVSPPDGATGQALTSRVGLTLSDSVELASVNDTTFVVRPMDGAPLTGRYTVHNTLVNFEPDEPLAPATRYEVIVRAGGIADWAGNLVTDEVVTHFETEPASAAPPTGVAGLVGRWRLDEPAGEVIARDFSGHAANGALLGDARLGGGALALDGEGDTVRIDGAGLAFDGDLSVSLWVRTTSTSTRGADVPAEWWRGEWWVDRHRGPGGRGWAITNHFGKATFYLNRDDDVLVSTTRIDDGEWHHVAATRRAADGARRLYVDGRLESEARSGSTDTIFTRPSLYLGSSSGVSQFARAELKDVRVYARVLGAKDVAGVMEGRAEPGEPLAIDLAETSSSVAGGEARFTAGVSGAGKPRVSWDFGDGSPATEPRAATEAAHTYAEPGHYQVVVTVSDGAREERTTFSHTVHRALPEAPPTTSSTIAYDARRGRVWAVNPDSDTVTALAASGHPSVLFEVPVGRHPRTRAVPGDGSVWVACQDDDRVVVLDGDRGTVRANLVLPRGSQPFAIAADPAGTTLYVTLFATGEVAAIDARTREVRWRAAVGPKPRGLAVTPDGRRLFVSRFVSPAERGEVRSVRAADGTVEEPIALAADTTTVDAEDRGRGVPNYVGAPVISSDAAELWVPSKQDNVFRGLARDGRPLEHDKTTRAVTSRVELASGHEVTGGRIDFNDRAMPSAVAFTPLGDYAFVAMQGSSTVEIRDAYTGAAVGAVDKVGKAPQGLVLSPDGSRLFVQGFMSRTVTVHDTAGVLAGRELAPPRVASLATVAAERLAPEVRRGKQLFYGARDPRISRDGYISCAGCHADGDDDGRVWDFTDRGEGLRNTIALVGRAGTAHGPVHWTANFDEIQDFENDIRNAFGGAGLMSDADFHAGTRAQSLGDPKAE
ncbi:MAG: Ig-like domain-containing protein [Deltaproteobacteria bacterium]|nr:Ig-like domain-containing protein [Deltaproteobacteria bacterium]